MKYVNVASLERCYELLAKKIAMQNPDNKSTKISFHSGYVWEQEGYKYDVWRNARDAIAAIPWGESGLVGSGKIKAGALNALKAFNIKAHGKLIDWRDINYFKNVPQIKELEHALYGLYAPNASVEDKLSFGALNAVIKNKYVLLSCLFFVKNKEKYMVMRPKNFAWRLNRIGVKESCTFPPSWDNYMTYMGALQEVKAFLAERHTGAENITLLDAHSFVWSLWVIEKDLM